MNYEHNAYIQNRTPFQSGRLRAAGNLTYLDFIRLIERTWALSHPDIPFLASGTANEARYPCIVYSLFVRRPLTVEPKMRHREAINTGQALIGENGQIIENNDALIIYGQRFQNVIKFTAMDEVSNNGAQTVEELIEVFEDWMFEMIPLFKFYGLSDIKYNQRHPDDEDQSPGDDVLKRTISFTCVIEKIVKVNKGKLERIAATIRIARPEDEATPAISPDEPFYEEDLANDDANLYRGVFERIKIVDDNRTDPG